MQDTLTEFDQRYGVLYKEMEIVLTQNGKCAELKLAPDSIRNGRLCFLSDVEFETTESALLAVQFFGRGVDIDVCLLSSATQEGLFKLELKITAEIALKARILLQLAEIVHYRKELNEQGAAFSVDEAAAQWISKYAAGFAAEFDKHINVK